MKKITYIILIAALLQSVTYYTYAQTKIQVVAHRGDWRNAPENSLRAFQSAADMGVDMVELDLNITKDRVLIIMHDETIDRSTNGKGKPSDYTLAELKEFRLKNGLGRVSNNQIPTLKEVMLALKNRTVEVNLDKSFPYFREAYAILKETGTLDKALFKSDVPFDSLKQRYPELMNNIRYMAVVNLDLPGAKEIITDYLACLKPYAFELNFTKDTSAILKDNAFIRKTGAKIWMNSLWASLNGGHYDDLAVEENNKKDSWDWLIEHGATILQTDRPKELLEYLKKKKLHQ